MNSWRRFWHDLMLTNYVLLNSCRRFWHVYFADLIRPNEFMATICSFIFHRQIMSSWINGDDFDICLSLTKFVQIKSWRRFTRFFFTDKFNPHKFMATILTSLFRWPNSSKLNHGVDLLVIFWQTNLVLKKSWQRFWHLFFADQIRPN